jgi:hypothetical protein
MLICEPTRTTPNSIDSPAGCGHGDTSAQLATELVFHQYDASERGAGLERWRCLERLTQDRGLTCSSDWVEVWLRHYGDLTQSRILIAEDAGRACGAALLSMGAGRRAGPLPVRSLHLGTAGEPRDDSFYVEYNRFLAAPDRRTEFAQGLVELVRQEDQWERFDLDGFELADAQLVLESTPGATLEVRQSPYFDLSKARHDGLEPIEMLGRSTRANIRRRLRQYGDVQIEWADTLAQAEDVFGELVTLHQERWRSVGHQGAFACGRFLEFQREILGRLVPSERVVLFRARCGGRTVGCLLLLVDHGDLLDYLSGLAGFDQFASPGLLTHYLCIEEALRRGYGRYDFLAGGKRHKQDLSTAARPLVWASWKRPTWKNRLIDAACRIKRGFRMLKARRGEIV